jgi:hypothetical protein
MAVSVVEEMNVIAAHGAYRAPCRRVATRYDKLAANYLAFQYPPGTGRVAELPGL